MLVFDGVDLYFRGNLVKTNGIVTLGNVTTYKYIFSMSSSKVNILKHFSFWED